MSYMVEVDPDKCIGDEECVEVCPVDVYEMQDGKAVPVNMEAASRCASRTRLRLPSSKRFRPQGT